MKNLEQILNKQAKLLVDTDFVENMKIGKFRKENTLFYKNLLLDNGNTDYLLSMVNNYNNCNFTLKILSGRLTDELASSGIDIFCKKYNCHNKRGDGHITYCNKTAFKIIKENANIYIKIYDINVSKQIVDDLFWNEK